MNRIVFSTIALAVTACGLMAEEKMKLADLPPAVQAAVKRETKNATLVGVSKETEDRQTKYEVETKVNGRTRDLLLDASGTVLEVEEEVELSKIPAAARKAIEKAAGTGSVTRVEALTRGTSVSYEAGIKETRGGSSEVTVNADGSPHK